MWQFACQVMILIADVLESWQGIDIQRGESCNPFRVLSIAMTLIQACNITLIMIIYCEHRLVYRNQEQCFKLKISVTLSLELIGSALICWYSCFSSFPNEFLSRMAKTVIVFAIVAFVVFLLAAGYSIVMDEPHADIKLKNSMKTSPVLCNGCKVDKKLIALLLMCLVVLILSEVPRFSLRFSKILCLLITRIAVGFVIPSTVYDMIQSIFKEENRKELVLI